MVLSGGIHLQPSEFVSGGLGIGISFTYILADPTSVTLFYKSWTDVKRGEPSEHSPPILGLPHVDNTTLPTTTGNMINWLESSHKGMDGVYQEALQMYRPKLTFVSLEHLMTTKDDSQDDIESLIYDARFRNNKKPLHVSYRVGKAMGEGLIVIAPSPEGGVARTMTVTLPTEEIVKLCQDSVIMEMEPTMIMSDKI
uniref:Protein eceriferum 26-like n=1 Tax=Tanacetum cinerariifolium TaxID=118510 RepID=A0A6L2L345_TANCI|nr:protein eceriferum 26-like [Tanacetum cinerariifolium]